MLRAEKDTTSENLQAERDQHLKELESVNGSLNALSSSNGRLDVIIQNKRAVCERQEQEIQTKSQAIDKLASKVSTP